MSGLFGGGRQSIPTPAPPPDWSAFKMPEFPTVEFPAMPEFPAFPAPFDPEAAAARQRRADEQERLRQIEMRRKGYASTLLTGGQGDTTTPEMQQPSLLGR